MHPVIFHVGRWNLYSYGALIALGGALATAFWLSRWKGMGLAKREDVWLLVNAILISGFVGGRLLFIVEYVGFDSDRLWDALTAFNRGFSVMGAFASVVGGVYFFTRRLGLDFRRVLDYVCQAAPLWHAFGRLGCFAAGCCFGRPSGAPWAVTFTDPGSMVPEQFLGVPLHPTQLYEAGGDLLIAAALYFFVLPRVEKGTLRRGTVAAAYFGAYALLRFGTEFFRGDIVSMPALGLTAAQALSLALAAGAVAVIFRSRSASCTRS